jgi:WD40 repeat protein
MAAQAERFYIIGGTLPTYAPSYIVRQADINLLQELKAGEFCYVLNTRQIGKSSLMVRTAQKLRAEGHLVALLDLTAIGQNVTVEAWYDGLLTLIAEQLRMEDELEDFWRAHAGLGPMQRFVAAIRRIVLERREERLFLFIDEIDAVRSLPFSTDEFFTGIRECYNRRGQDPAFERLTFCLLGVATPADLISDTRMSPFNIGRRIVLSDFTPEEILSLAPGLRCADRSGANARPDRDPGSLQQAQHLLTRIFYWTHGHPYLTQRLCHALSRLPGIPQSGDVDRLCQELFLSAEAQNTDDNMAFVRSSLLRHAPDVAALLDLYRQVRLNRHVRNDLTHPLHVALRLSGIVRVDNSELKVRNRIYERVFNPEWILANMPGAELRRQRAAYRRGVGRAATLFGSLAILITALLLIAIGNARHARAAEKRAAHALYISDINLMQREWENSNTAYVQELLNETQRSPERGLEWDYWNRQSHQSIRSVTLPEPVRSVAIVPGQSQVTISGLHGMLKQWDFITGEVRRTLTVGTGTASMVRYSPDGTKLIIACVGQIQIRDAASWRLLRTMASPNGDLWRFAISPDGMTIATLTEMDDAFVYNAATGQVMHRFGPARGNNPDALFNVAFTRGQLALFHKNGWLTLHDLHTGREIRRLKTDIEIGGICFSHDGARLVGRDKNGDIDIRDALNGKTLVHLCNDAAMLYARFSPDERLLFTAQGNAVNVWDSQSGRLLHTYRDHTDLVQAVDGSRDDRFLISGANDSAVKIWDLQLPSNPLTLHVSRKALWHVTYSPDGARLATGSDDGRATLWDAATGHRMRTLQTGKSRIVTVAFSHDGDRIFTGDSAGTGRLWEVNTGRLLHTFLGHSATINCAAFSWDDRQLFTGSDDRKAILWDLRTGKIVRRFEEHVKSVEALTVTRDGTRLITGGDDLKVIVWDVRSGKSVSVIKTPAEVWGVALSPDQTRLAAGNLRKTVEIYDLESGKRVQTLRGHSNWIVGVAFSPDGRRLASTSRDSTVKIWELETGRDVLTLKGHKGQVADVAFSPADGCHIATVGEDGDMIIWDATPLPAGVSSQPR